MTESDEIKRLKAEIKALRDIIDEKPGKMVGNSGEMREVYKQIKKCAKNDGMFPTKFPVSLFPSLQAPSYLRVASVLLHSFS